MSATLNLADQLLARGRHFQNLGREQEAAQIYNRLTGFKLLSNEVAEEAKSRLAELLLRWGRFTRARRHLTALLAQCPRNARYHYLMAAALNGDERSDPKRAAEQYRKSLALDPEQPRCLGEFGLLALRLGQRDEGLNCLRRAVELAPDNVEAVGHLVEGLRQECLLDEASAVLRAARFRNARDARFTKLWNDFQFRQLREQQKSAANPALLAIEGNGPRILPFVRPESSSVRIRTHGKIVRSDAPAALQPPRIANQDQVPDKKHA